MRFKTVREILDFVREFHARARRLYDSTASRVPSQRLAWLLKWLGEHETRLTEALSRFESDPSNKTILDEWMQHVPPTDATPIDVPELGERMTEDQALVLALALDNYLLVLFETLMRQTDSEPVRDLLRSLMTQERAEKLATVRGFTDMSDI